MGEEDKVYKKFFLQKSVLDSLRVYIELTDEFYASLSTIEIIPKDELDKIKEMQWPLNRNILLQTIVKLPWDKNAFEQFCQTIEETQSEQLIKQVVEKAREVIKSLAEPDDIEISGDFKEREGDQITLQTKNAIKTELRDRDEKIRTLETENRELKTKMAVISADNQDVNNQSAELDKCVSDMLTAIKFDLEEGPVEALLLKVSEIYWRNIDKIKRLNDDIKSLKNANKELRERVTMFTEENISLKSQLNDSRTHYEVLLSTTNETTNKLTEDLRLEKEKSNKLQLALRTSTTRSAKEVEALEEDLKAAKSSISKMKKDVGIANRDRDAAKEELKEINDRTRKLLISLDLLNSCDSTSLSVDHARNISYARRRRGPNAPPLPPPSEETMSIAADLADRILPDRGTNPWKGQTGGELPIIPNASPKADHDGANSIAGSSNSHSSDTPSHTTATRPGSAAHSRCETPSELAASSVRCATCGKTYLEASNFDGACLTHQPGATMLNGGTGMEVWSCCKSVDSLKGCVRGKHTAVQLENN